MIRKPSKECSSRRLPQTNALDKLTSWELKLSIGFGNTEITDSLDGNFRRLMGIKAWNERSGFKREWEKVKMWFWQYFQIYCKETEKWGNRFLPVISWTCAFPISYYSSQELRPPNSLVEIHVGPQCSTYSMYLLQVFWFPNQERLLSPSACYSTYSWYQLYWIYDILPFSCCGPVLLSPLDSQYLRHWGENTLHSPS